MNESTKYRLVADISRGDKRNIRAKIIRYILASPKHKSYLTELENALGITKRTLLLHLGYLVHKGILSFEYQTVPVGEDRRPVVIKWYRVKEEHEWLKEIASEPAVAERR